MIQPISLSPPTHNDSTNQHVPYTQCAQRGDQSATSPPTPSAHNAVTNQHYNQYMLPLTIQYTKQSQTQNMSLNIEIKMFNLSDATRYQSSDVKSEGNYNLDTSENISHTECTCLDKENPQIKDMCTSVKELLGI